tara:strand:+ start:317 stop:499 length:183 start_codon:yes stop_codon:yes gene_type:complete
MKMNIQSAQYYNDSQTKEKDHIILVVDGVNMSVPLDPANRHYAAILEWAKEDGNTIQEAE